MTKNPTHGARVAEHPIDDMFVSRWSPRAFDPSPLSNDDLLTILEAARWAPSGGNVQPWRFVYALRGDDFWPALLGSLVPSNQVWAQKAAALVAVTSTTVYFRPNATDPTPNPSHAFDAGAAWGYLALQAMRSGFAAHAMGGFDAAAAATAIELPPSHVVHAIVAIGKRGDPQDLPEALRARETPNPRKPLSETTFHGRFPSSK